MATEIIINSDKNRFIAAEAIKSLKNEPLMVVKIEQYKENRTLDQNSAQWPILNAIAAQRKWPVDGELMFLDGESWKDILTAAYRKEVPIVAKAFSLNTTNNYDTGSVMIGQRTRKFKRGEFNEWLEFLNAAAVQLGVKVPMSKKQAAIYE